MSILCYRDVLCVFSNLLQPWLTFLWTTFVLVFTAIQEFTKINLNVSYSTSQKKGQNSRLCLQEIPFHLKDYKR